jgi:hypothetical protein
MDPARMAARQTVRLRHGQVRGQGQGAQRRYRDPAEQAACLQPGFQIIHALHGVPFIDGDAAAGMVYFGPGGTRVVCPTAPGSVSTGGSAQRAKACGRM